MSATENTPSPAPGRDDHVLLVNRLAHAILVVVVFPFFVGTTFFPQYTDKNFAWPLAPRMSAFLFGSLYLTVIYAFARVALARKWHHIALVMWTTIPVLAALGVTTLLHWDRFTHNQPPFYVWMVVYVFLPPVLAVLAWVNSRRDPREREPGDVAVTGTVRLISLLLSAVFIAVGGGLLFAPEFMATIWPWPLKPLSSRAIGCLFLAPAVSHLVALYESRWSAFRIVTQSAIIWFVGILVAVGRAWSDLDKSRPLMWVFVAFVAVEFVFSVATYRHMEDLRHEARHAA